MAHCNTRLFIVGKWTQIFINNINLYLRLILLSFPGKKGYMLDNRYGCFKRGTILSNLLLRNLQPGLLIYEIAANMNQGLSELEKFKLFSGFINEFNGVF